MDPFVEKNPLFHELHTQILTAAQIQLQPQLRPKYVARLERHLSEGSVWEGGTELVSLQRKEPDLTVMSGKPGAEAPGSTAVLATPAVRVAEELDEDELQLRKQRRIVIYVLSSPRLAVASIELLSPSNKQSGSVGQKRYLEKRSSALHGGLHWIEIDLLRGGERPPMAVAVPAGTDYLAYVAQAIPTGWDHLLYPWKLADPLPRLPIPLLESDQASLDLGACFRSAYDGTAADDEVDYNVSPPPPPLGADVLAWMDTLLRGRGLRQGPQAP
jgi:hypothetical protein